MFLRLHKGENKYNVNVDAIFFIEEARPGMKGSPCVIHSIYGQRLTVDETLRQLTGRINKLFNTNHNSNDTEEDSE